MTDPRPHNDDSLESLGLALFLIIAVIAVAGVAIVLWRTMA